MSTQILEYFVKITPRDKYDYGSCSMSNRDTPEKQNEYNEKAAKDICADVNDHKTFEMKRVEVCDNSYELELESDCDDLKNRVKDLEQFIKELSVCNLDTSADWIFNTCEEFLKQEDIK